MKKRFIVLIDFSAYSLHLLQYACDWSKQVDAEVLLLHQTLVFAPALADNETRKQIVFQTNTDALIQLKALVTDNHIQTGKISFYVTETSLNTTLERLLADPFDNLLFVGLKGTKRIKQLVLGSVALQVIEKNNNCVVALPAAITKFNHPRILVAVSEKHPLNILELNNFLKFVDSEATKINFFYLAKPKEETTGIEKQLRQLSELFADRFTTDYTLFEGDNPFNDIKNLINNKTDELLVVQKGTRYFTDQLFRKFMVSELVYEGETPLVVLP